MFINFVVQNVTDRDLYIVNFSEKSNVWDCIIYNFLVLKLWPRFPHNLFIKYQSTLTDDTHIIIDNDVDNVVQQMIINLK